MVLTARCIDERKADPIWFGTVTVAVVVDRALAGDGNHLRSNIQRAVPCAWRALGRATFADCGTSRDVPGVCDAGTADIFAYD